MSRANGLKRVGGQRVERGGYWNAHAGDYVRLSESGVLPGEASDTYFKVPAPVMLLAAPLLGLVYALFLPFVGLAMVAALVARKLWSGAVGALWRAAAFGWQPAEAYLSGRAKRKSKSKGPQEGHNEGGGDEGKSA